MIPIGDDSLYESWPYNQIGVLYQVTSDNVKSDLTLVKKDKEILALEPKKNNPIGFIWK